MRNAFICSFSDPQDYLIRCSNRGKERTYRFEFSERFGPQVINKNGRGLDRQPGPRHQFWIAVTQWKRQGKRVGEDGICIWEPEPPFDFSDFVQIGKRTWVAKSLAAEYGVKDINA